MKLNNHIHVLKIVTTTVSYRSTPFLCWFTVRSTLCAQLLYQSRHEKPTFCICENKGANQLHSNCAADQHVCFPCIIVQSLYCLNPNFQSSSHLLWLSIPVCVGPGRKPRRHVFLCHGSFHYNRAHLIWL